MHRLGVVTGHVFRLARESTGLSQQLLAEALGVDRGTVQGWETGRRPLTAVPLSRVVTVRHQMHRLGAAPALLGWLFDAAETDHLVAETITAGQERVDLDTHPLGSLVLTHRLSELVKWVVTGEPPMALAGSADVARRGPAAPGPALTAEERDAFHRGLRHVAERSAHRPGMLLLHRQACFLSGMHANGVAGLLRRSVGSSSRFVRPEPWSPEWADARSVAAALERRGDPDPLRAFIANDTGPGAELAGLNYSAYWVGEISGRQYADDFMTDSLQSWRGGALLRHLTDRLDPTFSYLDLTVHTLWVLLSARRGLALDDPALGRRLAAAAARLHDEGDISEQSKRELVSILYGLRADGIQS